MTDLDSTEIITNEESFIDGSSSNEIKGRLKIIAGTDVTTYEVTNESIVGRATPSTIIIPASSLSKQHAKLTFNNGQYFVVDLGSSNKTFHNKVQIQPNVCYALHHGDELKFGDIICTFEEERNTNNVVESKMDVNSSNQPMVVADSAGKTEETTKVNGNGELMMESENTDREDVMDEGASTEAVKPTEMEATPTSTDENKRIDDPPGELPVSEGIQETDMETTTNIKQDATDDQMDSEKGSESPVMTIDEKQTDADRMEEELVSDKNNENMTVDEGEKPTVEVPLTKMEDEENVLQTNDISIPVAPTENAENMVDETTSTTAPVDEELEDEKNQIKEEPVSHVTRGVSRRKVPRARSRRVPADRTRVISTRIHGGRRNAVLPPVVNTEENNTTLEETVTTETEESPKKTPSKSQDEANKSKKNKAFPSNQPNSTSNIRVSARIKERVSSGRNRQFPYTDDYVDLDNLEKQPKASATPTSKTPSRERTSESPQKKISLRQQPIDSLNTSVKKSNTDIYEDIDAVAESKQLTPTTTGRKRKSTTPVTSVPTKRSRPPTPQTVPATRTRRKQQSTITVDVSPTVTRSNRRTIGEPKQSAITVTAANPSTTVTDNVTPKRGRKSTKQTTPIEESTEKSASTVDRPVRVALSSHLNFDQTNVDKLRELGFEIMDESCQVDALVVDRIRRTKKFFMCLARGAHILSPTWIEAMIKEKRYVPYDKYYLEDKTAETRYGFQLRESVRLAKQQRIFENRKFFCTKDTSPPYDDLKDIIESAGGKLLDKINMSRPAKDTICIVAQTHKSDYEDLFKKGLSIVSEEFILSGISKQTLDFDSFSLFQNATTNKAAPANK